MAEAKVDPMAGFPRNGTKDEILAWLRVKAPTGLVRRDWRNSLEKYLKKVPESYIINNLPLENLRTLMFLNEIGKYTTKGELFQAIPFEEYNESGAKITYANNNSNQKQGFIPSEKLKEIFGSAPPYFGNISPTTIARLEEFDFSVLTPTFPSVDLPEPPAELPYKEGKGITLEELKEARSQLAELIEKNKSIFLDQMAILVLPESPPLEKIKALTELIKVKFFIYSDMGRIDFEKENPIDPSSKHIGYFYNPLLGYHSFLEEYIDGTPTDGWKVRSRLANDSKELIFARAVSGLFLFLALQIPPEDISKMANQKTFVDFFQSYLYSFGFVTYDMVPLKHQMELVARVLNAHVGFNFLVVDCEKKYEKTERCGRAVMYVDNDKGTYRIIVTNVDYDANLTQDNSARLMGKYYSFDGSKGGRRKTHKQKQKKRAGKSRRWRK